MHVTIGTTDYTEISALTFAPETDVTGVTAPVNELVVDIRTQDEIEVGSTVSLYDDEDRLWASYWVTDPVRLDEYTVRVRGRSALMVLDRITVSAVMYDQTSVATVLASLLSPVGSYTLDPSFSSATLSGYAPEQTARERLQWIALVIGAYIKDYDGAGLRILPVDDEEGEIPIEYTYWKPDVTWRDHVTAVRAKAYTYAVREPSTKDTWVEVGGTAYVQSEQSFTITNPAAPALAPENIVSVEDVTIINEANVDDVLTNLAAYYFSRVEMNLDAVNNAQWWPGQRVMAHSDEEGIYSGWINSAIFTFGLQAKSTLHITAADSRNGATLIILYMWEGKKMGERRYRLPVEYEYQIENPYLQMPFAGHYYVFRPEEEFAEGTIAEGGTEDEQEVDVALDYYSRVLTVTSVDEFTLQEEEKYDMGVIE